MGTQEIAYIALWESKDIALAALPWVDLNMMQTQRISEKKKKKEHQNVSNQDESLVNAQEKDQPLGRDHKNNVFLEDF